MLKDQRIKKILVSQKQINTAAKQAGKWIDKNYTNSIPILVGLLKGCIPFFSKVLNQVKIDCETDFLYVTSFAGQNKAQSEPIIKSTCNTSIKNRDVVIIEDIIDSGKTLLKIKNNFLKNGAKSVKIVTMLDKPANRKVKIEADKTFFTIPDLFVVGFGLDYQELFRNLPYIGILKDYVYNKALVVKNGRKKSTDSR